MASGGLRNGSGRPKKFTFNQKLALANEVTIIQRERSLSRVEALPPIKTPLSKDWGVFLFKQTRLIPYANLSNTSIMSIKVINIDTFS